MSAELLEREAELEAVDASIESARAGRGSVLLVEGPPGIGKTALLEAARERASEVGFASLSARGSELEHDFAFGVARQLFERPIAELDEREREEVLSGAAGLSGPLFELDGSDSRPPPDGSRELFPLLHGLHWLCSNLAESEPLLLAIDDSHWADDPSLRFLDYLAGRISELPVLVTASARSTAPEAPVELIEGLRGAPAVDAIAPGTLSEAGVVELLAAVLSEPPEPGFARAAARASGGNPFLLTELARALAADGVPPNDESIERVKSISPEAIAGSVLTRVARMPGETAEVVRAVAVLGDGADLGAVAELSSVSPDAVEQAADTLVEGGVLDRGLPLRFSHPLVRAAIYDDLAANERARMHARAAGVLDSLGASPEASAAHLLRAPPAGESGRLALLRNAADSALGRGAPAAAADYLRRALDEAPRDADRRALLGALGRAEVQGGDPAGIEDLKRALDLGGDLRERGGLVRVMGLGLAQSARFPEAIEAFEALARELGAVDDAPREVRLDIESDLAVILLFGLDADDSTLDQLLAGVEVGKPSASRAQRSRLALFAYRLMQRSVDARRAAAAAEQAFEEGIVDDYEPGYPSYLAALIALIAADGLDSARRPATEVFTRERAAASPLGFGQSATALSWIAFREGRMADAESYADEAVAGIRPHGVVIVFLPALSALVDAMIERGKADAAWAELEVSGATGELPEIVTTPNLLESRAKLRAARGDLHGARDDLLKTGSLWERAGGVGPGFSSWRSQLALVRLQLGEIDDARRLATEELVLARRFGAPRATGVALRAVGLVEGGEHGLELLAEAAEVLAGSRDRLEHARALVELGAALRRGNQRTEARERLRAGLEIATRCGATVLAERARDELLATGARPRKPFYSGVEALTPAELRTARMAAEGKSNREIAQALFVTPKTVETHLRHTYRKLDIPGRSGLADALSSTKAAG